jgi:xanthine dehydrogenase accessory factor
MKDIYDIVNHVRSDPRGPWALATLVTAIGSSYRRPGARMLVHPDGCAIGSLSGGCLEEEVAAEAREVLRTGTPKLIRFDTRKRFGCNGEIQIFIERTEPDFFAEIARRLEQRQTCALRTVFASGAVGEAVSFPDKTLGTHLIDLFPREREANSFPYSPSPETVLVQEVHPPIRLFIVGQWPDSAPIREMSQALGWLVVEAATIHELEITPDGHTAALVKSHNYGKDFAALRILLPLNLSYIGLIGPRGRRDQLLHDLLDVGVAINAGFFAPAGLDLHSETPAEIALAVVSEIQRVFAGGTGASLRERKVPIHVAANVGSADAVDSKRPAAIFPD